MTDDHTLPNGEPFPFWEDETTYTRTYHVAQRHTHASDDNTGTADQPFATICRAAELLEPGLELLEDGLVQRDRPSAVFNAHVKVEDLGLAKLGPLRRTELDILTQRGDIAIGGPGTRVLATSRWTNFPQGGLQNATALDDFQYRFLDGLHFLGIAELARFPLGVRRFVADDQGLRGVPSRFVDHGVNAHAGRDQNGRHKPQPHVVA